MQPVPAKMCAFGKIPQMTENDEMKVLEQTIHFDVKMHHDDVNMDWAAIQQPSPG